MHICISSVSLFIEIDGYLLSGSLFIETDGYLLSGSLFIEINGCLLNGSLFIEINGYIYMLIGSLFIEINGYLLNGSLCIEIDALPGVKITDCHLLCCSLDCRATSLSTLMSRYVVEWLLLGCVIR